MINHADFREKKELSAVINIREFKAYRNVILISGAGYRRYCGFM